MSVFLIEGQSLQSRDSPSPLFWLLPTSPYISMSHTNKQLLTFEAMESEDVIFQYWGPQGGPYPFSGHNRAHDIHMNHTNK